MWCHWYIEDNFENFENHKLGYTIKYGFKKKNLLFIWINDSTFHFLNVNFLYNYLQLIKSKSKIKNV
jgi:hypothetical protein